MRDLPGIGKRVYRNIKIFMRNKTTFYMEVKLKSHLKRNFKNQHIHRNQDVYGYISKVDRGKNRRAINVVFICQVPAIWNSCRSIFETALEDEYINEFIVAVPEKIMGKNYDVCHEIYGENKAFNFCKSFYEKTINAYDEHEKRWFDLKLLKPDYIFLSRPYDIHLPPEYRSSVLCNYTKICYVPYSYCKMNWDSRMVYSLDFLDNVYMVFTENIEYCKVLTVIYYQLFSAKWKKIKYFGYPRFDLYNEKKISFNKFKKTVLWLPRWTTDSSVEATTFFKFKNFLISYFKKHPEICFICRPHPLMLRNFISTGEMTERERTEFLDVFEQNDNFEFDESGDYLPSFMQADIFISDTSSLLVEELITGKPIIYCGKVNHFDKNAKNWAKLMYTVSDEKEMAIRLDALLGGEDLIKNQRKKYIESNMKVNGSSGKKIVAFLKKDFYGNG